MKKIRLRATLAILGVSTVLGMSGCTGKLSVSQDRSSAENSSAREAICVYVTGYVQNPGMYALYADATVGDAIEKAGGFSDGADENYWNTSETMSDGEKIRILGVDEKKESPAEE